MKAQSILTRLLLCTLLALMWSNPFPCRADEARFTEYEVKAGFIYNIAKFVEWPDRHLPDSKNSITFCVLGADPFGRALDLIEGKTVKGRIIELRHTSSLKEARDCHILFISGSEKERLPRIMEALRDSAVLTIGDTGGYAEQGVISLHPET